MEAVLMVVAAALAIPEAMATTTSIVYPANPDHPSKCYYPALNLAIPYGRTHFSRRECVLHFCFGTKDMYRLVSVGCRALTPHPGCRLVRDNMAWHPDCCPREEC